MKARLIMALLVIALLCPLSTSAGEKVLTVPADGLMVEGSLPDGDLKVKVMDPSVKNAEMPAKLYEIKLSAGKLYTLVTDSQFDSYLVVQDKSGKQLAIDDDSAGNYDARLLFTPPKDDTYKVYVAALQGQGKYRLKIAMQEFKVLDASAGVKVEGEIKKDNPSTIYHVKLTQGKTYVIDMMAAADSKLDSFLRLIDPSGKQVAADDDGGEGNNSRITFQAPETGTYQIVSSALLNATTGRYTLAVQAK